MFVTLHTIRHKETVMKEKLGSQSMVM